MSTQFYVWTNGTVKEIWPDDWHRYDGCYFYDPLEQDPKMKWGQCVFRSWAERTINDVPKEFRLALLLMGVNP